MAGVVSALAFPGTSAVSGAALPASGAVSGLVWALSHFSASFCIVCSFDIRDRFEDWVDLLRDDGVSEASKAVHP